MKLSKIAGAVPFAHLLGLAAAKAEDDEDKKDKDTAKRAENDDDEDKQRADESDDDYAKRMEEKDDKDEAAKAESDDEKKDEDDEGDAKGKKAKRAEDDDDGEMARAAERGRCAKIIAHGIATGSVRQAGIFAFDTDMTAVQAIKALDASAADGKSRPAGLRERMSGVRVPNVGTDGGAGAATDPNDPQAKANAIILAGKKRRGEV